MFYSPLGSLGSRVAQARRCGDLYFATLLSQETISLVFGEASAILGAARIYNTSVFVGVPFLTAFSAWGFPPHRRRSIDR